MVMGMSESIYRKLEALVLILLLLLMLFWAKAQAGALQTEISAAPVDEVQNVMDHAVNM